MVKYRVGHSAAVLVERVNWRSYYYFDFGRYHTPKGFGRVRNVKIQIMMSVIQLITAEIKDKRNCKHRRYFI